MNTYYLVINGTEIAFEAFTLKDAIRQAAQKYNFPNNIWHENQQYAKYMTRAGDFIYNKV